MAQGKMQDEGSSDLKVQRELLGGTWLGHGVCLTSPAQHKAFPSHRVFLSLCYESSGGSLFPTQILLLRASEEIGWSQEEDTGGERPFLGVF